LDELCKRLCRCNALPCFCSLWKSHDLAANARLAPWRDDRSFHSRSEKA
jgi:hypothetical protein